MKHLLICIIFLLPSVSLAKLSKSELKKYEKIHKELPQYDLSTAENACDIIARQETISMVYAVKKKMVPDIFERYFSREMTKKGCMIMFDFLDNMVFRLNKDKNKDLKKEPKKKRKDLPLYHLSMIQGLCDVTAKRVDREMTSYSRDLSYNLTQPERYLAREASRDGCKSVFHWINGRYLKIEKDKTKTNKKGEIK